RAIHGSRPAKDDGVAARRKRRDRRAIDERDGLEDGGPSDLLLPRGEQENSEPRRLGLLGQGGRLIGRDGRRAGEAREARREAKFYIYDASDRNFIKRGAKPLMRKESHLTF